MSDETEPEVPAFGLEDAKQLIERMKLARVTCFDRCITVGYQQASGAYAFTKHGKFTDELIEMPAVTAWMKKYGFELASDRPGYLGRCRECEVTPMFPWADKLSPEAVLQFVLTDPRCEQAFELSILEDTLKPHPMLVVGHEAVNA